jgi:hypothetical protein
MAQSLSEKADELDDLAKALDRLATPAIRTSNRGANLTAGPGFSWLVENLIALVPGLQIEWGQYWVEHRWNRGQ